MDHIVELARMLKERENTPYLGPMLGVVVAAPPDICVKLGDQILLYKDDLVIAAHVLSGYKRKATYTGTFPTSTELVGSPYEHQHSVTSPMSGDIETTDTLAVGDQVILIPTTNAQIYYLIDKAVGL
ncbi:MAG: DUF2577 domain-containing protein [Syntrophomonadaceae bacterium]|nr:DUF2577 domain-containing protein [Syntrophomonadaceae bacterium]